MAFIKEMKKRFEAYDRAKKHFSETHDCLSCFYCDSEIKPGEDFVYDGGFSEEVFCSWECFGLSKQASMWTFNEDDEEYMSMFPEKLED